MNAADRRTRSRVQRPVVRRTPEWPAAGLIVVDAASGDLLTVVPRQDAASGPSRSAPEGMPTT